MLKPFFFSRDSKMPSRPASASSTRSLRTVFSTSTKPLSTALPGSQSRLRSSGGRLSIVKIVGDPELLQL